VVQQKQRTLENLPAQLQKLLKPALRALACLTPSKGPPDGDIASFLHAVLARPEPLDAAKRHATQLLSPVLGAK
jgi:hypothetical protein